MQIELKARQEQVLQKSSAFEMKSAFAVKQNSVLQIDLIDKKISEIHKLKDLYLPKVMAIDDSNSLIIGG